MRNIAKRSVALLLLVALVLSVCQGVVVPTFADNTAGSTVSTVATDPPDSGGGAEETCDTSTAPTEDGGALTEDPSTAYSEPVEEETSPTEQLVDEQVYTTDPTEPVTETTTPSEQSEEVVTEPTEPVTEPSIQYERAEAEEYANANCFDNLEVGYEGASNGCVVGDLNIKDASLLVGYDELNASSLEDLPYVKYNVSAEADGKYELRIGVALSGIRDTNFYIPVMVNESVYKAVYEGYEGEDGLYEFIVKVDLIEGENQVYCLAFDSDSYVGSDTEVMFDYLNVPDGVNILDKNEVTEVPDEQTPQDESPIEKPGDASNSLLIPSPDIMDPSGNGTISPLAGGSTGSGTGTGGGIGTGDTSGWTGGILQGTAPGVSLQVVYYKYKYVYNAELLYNQVLNSVRNYSTTSDKALNASGGVIGDTVFAPYYLTKNIFFMTIWDSYSWIEGNVYKLRTSALLNGLPGARVVSGNQYQYDLTFGSSQTVEQEYGAAVSNFLKRIILGNKYGSWNIGDVYSGSGSDTSTYTKVLKMLGASSTSIANYQSMLAGNMNPTTSDGEKLIPVVIWKYVVWQGNSVGSSGSGSNKSSLLVPADIPYQSSPSAAKKWWDTSYKWDTSTNYASHPVYKGMSSLLGHSSYCPWNANDSYLCKMVLGTGHYDGHGYASTSFGRYNRDAIGSGNVNAIATTGYNNQKVGQNAYLYRGYWGPFNANSSSGSLKITKVSSADSSQKLQGATFVLYKDSACTKPVTQSDYVTYKTSDAGFVNASTRKTNSSGVATFSGLRVGTYFLKETGAPSGYRVNATAISVSIAKNKTTNKTVSNQPDSQPFTLQKRCNTVCSGQLSGNPMYSLAGAQYEIYVNGKLSETLTTDAKGNATSSKKYSSGTKITVKEVKASPGYVITQPNPNTFTITNSASKNVFTVYENPTFDPTGLIFTKVDPSTGKPQGGSSFEGAIFKIDYYANTNWSGSPTKTWYFKTNENGYFVYNSNYLAPGYSNDTLYTSVLGYNQFPLGSVKVTEIVAPYGYSTIPTLYATITQPSNGSDGKFSWTAESAAYIDGGAGNYTGKEPQDTSTFGRFTVQKVDSQTGSNPQGGVANLSAKFQVINRSANSVKIGDNAVAAPGAVCYEFWTDASGNFTSEYIFPMGTYEIKEVTPPEGMLLNSTWSKTFTVTKSNKDFTFTGVNACSNGIIRGDVKVYKYDSLLDGDTDETVKFEGITFSVYSENTNDVVVNGVTYSRGDVVATIPLAWDADELAWVAKTTGQLLPYGTYTIKENPRVAGSGYANDYYFLCRSSYTFTIRNNGEVVTASNTGSALVFENDPIARIELHKVNTAGEPLEGVKFLLEWSQDGDSWFPVEYLNAEGNIVGATTTPGLVDGCLLTDENGYLAFEGLDPYPYYRLTEVETLDGYQLLKDPVFVGTLERNSETIVEYSGRVVNVESFTLPKTGAKDMSFLSFALAICVTISFGALVYCKKKEKV